MKDMEEEEEKGNEGDRKNKKEGILLKKTGRDKLKVICSPHKIFHPLRKIYRIRYKSLSRPTLRNALYRRGNSFLVDAFARPSKTMSAQLSRL
jgi:hypothetical protein